jgi:hypothetical protein
MREFQGGANAVILVKRLNREKFRRRNILLLRGFIPWKRAVGLTRAAGTHLCGIWDPMISVVGEGMANSADETSV